MSTVKSCTTCIHFVASIAVHLGVCRKATVYTLAKDARAPWGECGPRAIQYGPLPPPLMCRYRACNAGQCNAATDF